MVSWGVAVPSTCITANIKAGRFLVGGYVSLLRSLYSDFMILNSCRSSQQAQR